MPTLTELKRQNEILRHQLQARKEMIDIGRERNKLLKENKALKFVSKHPRLVSFASPTAKLGTRFGKGLVKWANKVAEAERREQMAKRRMSSGRKRRRR